MSTSVRDVPSVTAPPLGPATSFCFTLLHTLKTISTPSLLSRSISLHIKLWSSEWPIVACCCCCCRCSVCVCACVCCDIFGYIKFFFPPGPRAFTSKRNRYTVCPPAWSTILLTSQANLNLGQFSQSNSFRFSSLRERRKPSSRSNKLDA